MARGWKRAEHLRWMIRFEIAHLCPEKIEHSDPNRKPLETHDAGGIGVFPSETVKRNLGNDQAA